MLASEAIMRQEVSSSSSVRRWELTGSQAIDVLLNEALRTEIRLWSFIVPLLRTTLAGFKGGDYSDSLNASEILQYPDFISVLQKFGGCFRNYQYTY